MADTRHAAGNGDARKAFAFIEGLGADARHSATVINRGNNYLRSASCIIRNHISSIGLLREYYAIVLVSLACGTSVFCVPGVCHFAQY